MVAGRLHCWVCGTAFYGRADARYCCGACRQRAHRTRTRRRAADKVVQAPALGDTVAQARENRERARRARTHAELMRRGSSAKGDQT